MNHTRTLAYSIYIYIYLCKDHETMRQQAWAVQQNKLAASAGCGKHEKHVGGATH